VTARWLYAAVPALLPAGAPPSWAGADNTLVYGQSMPVTSLGPEYGVFLAIPWAARWASYSTIASSPSIPT
jgi:hypothetical protein